MRWLPRGFLWRCKCRVVGVSRSGFYDWVGRDPSSRSLGDAEMLDMIQWSHERSRGTYGAPRVHADLTMERGVSCGRKRVARLMRSAGIRGVCHQRKRRGWKPLPAPHDDLVKRQFSAHAPDRVWFCDITQHRTTWIPAIVATLLLYVASSKAVIRSAGVSQSKAFRGRPFSSPATAKRSS